MIDKSFVKDAALFQPRNVIAAIAQRVQDGGVVRAKQRRHRADPGRSAIEARGRPRHSNFAEGAALEFFEQVIFTHLLILKQFKAAQNRRGRDVVTEQAGQDFARGPLLQLGGHDLAPFHPVLRPVARGFEARVIDEILAIQRAAHPRPFVVG